MLEGKTPTTPTASSVIAGIQVQEMLKLLHKDRNLPTLIGKGYVFNGLTHDSFVVEYQKKDDCMSHDTYENIIEMNWSAKELTLKELYEQAVLDLGSDAVVEFDRDIVTWAECSCGYKKEILRPVQSLRSVDVSCAKCNAIMNFEMIHSINGNEMFLDKTVHEIGIPLFHIVSARSGFIIRYYEFSKDANEVMGNLI
jgi:adenylyltransferase/sulfurtransferase